MAEVEFVLRPRDGFFFRDGRGAFTSMSSRARAFSWPAPSTLLGALRTAWGRALEKSEPGLTLDARTWPERTRTIELTGSLPLRAATMGPWSRDARMWPAPADALFVRGGATPHWLDPVANDSNVGSLGRATADAEAREALWFALPPTKVKAVPGPRWWTEREFVGWATRSADVGPSPDDVPQRTLPSRVQVQVAIDEATGTSRDGFLFSTEVAETLVARPRHGSQRGVEEWAIAVRVSMPSNGPHLDGLDLAVGGDARLARALIPDSQIFGPPDDWDRVWSEDSPGLRLLVVTPAWFEAGGWRLGGFTVRGNEYVGRLPGLDVDLVLRAAMIGRPLHVSGWDMAAGAPKDTRSLVPAGTVYFLQKASGAPFRTSEAAALWMQGVGSDVGSGFGRVVPAPWRPVVAPIGGR